MEKREEVDWPLVDITRSELSPGSCEKYRLKVGVVDRVNGKWRRSCRAFEKILYLYGLLGLDSCNLWEDVCQKPHAGALVASKAGVDPYDFDD